MTEKEETIKEFREKFGHCSCNLWLTEFAGQKAPRPKEIEEWLFSKLAQQKEELLKKIDKELNKICDGGENCKCSERQGDMNEGKRTAFRDIKKLI